MLMALTLVAVTLVAVDYTLSRHAGESTSPALTSPALTSPALTSSDVRQRVLVISLGSALLALVIATFVSRSLTLRVRRLKLLAESFPGGTLRDSPIEDSSDELGALERALGGVAIELQKLLDRLRFESARREAILSGMTEGVLAVDHELRVTFCNAAFLKAIDFRGPASEGLFLLALVRDPRLHELLRAAVSDGQTQKLRLQLSAANARTFEVGATPLEMASGRGAIAILHDI